MLGEKEKDNMYKYKKEEGSCGGLDEEIAQTDIVV